MKKAVAISTIILLLLTVLVVGALFMRDKSSIGGVSNEPTSQPVMGSVVAGGESEDSPYQAASDNAFADVSESSLDSGSVSISNEEMEQLLQDATSLEYENEYILADTPQYTVYLISHAQYFNVILKGFPYQGSLRAAEEYLAATIGVSPAELCAYNIDIFAPKEFDPTWSQDLGLSACPGPRAPGNL